MVLPGLEAGVGNSIIGSWAATLSLHPCSNSIIRILPVQHLLSLWDTGRELVVDAFHVGFGAAYESNVQASREPEEMYQSFPKIIQAEAGRSQLQAA